MTHMTTQREKLTSPLKIKNDGPGACRHQAGFPLWNGGPPPLRPFHVKGIKGFTRSTSRWFPSPYEHRSYFVHPISLRSAIGKFPCTFFDKPWNFPQGRGLGVLPMSRCDVIIPKKKQPPNLYRYIYIHNISNRYQKWWSSERYLLSNMVVYVILSLYVKFQVSDRHNSIPIHPPLEKTLLLVEHQLLK